jgi:hypothetical protein
MKLLHQEFSNTQYPLAALLAYYEAEKVLVTSATQNGDFTLAEKLEQTLVSILAGCDQYNQMNLGQLEAVIVLTP